MRKPGSAWIELPRPRTAGTEPVGHVRLGYARAPTARQSLDTQLDSLTEARVTRIFSEKIFTRATKRPELEKAVALARELRASGVRVTLVVHEHKRLGRGIDLATLAEALKASDVGLGFLTGELQGSHDPSGVVFSITPAPTWAANTLIWAESEPLSSRQTAQTSSVSHHGGRRRSGPGQAIRPQSGANRRRVGAGARRAESARSSLWHHRRRRAPGR